MYSIYFIKAIIEMDLVRLTLNVQDQRRRVGSSLLVFNLTVVSSTVLRSDVSDGVVLSTVLRADVSDDVALSR